MRNKSAASENIREFGPIIVYRGEVNKNAEIIFYCCFFVIFPFGRSFLRLCFLIVFAGCLINDDGGGDNFVTFGEVREVWENGNWKIILFGIAT